MSLKIDSLDPASVPVGWEGALTIHGSEFDSTGIVTIDGDDAKIKSWKPQEIQVSVTKSMTSSAGQKRLVVHSAEGGFDETQWTVWDEA
jgi:hypothetical protein